MVSIPPNDHSDTISVAIILIITLDHEDLPVTTTPPSPPTPPSPLTSSPLLLHHHLSVAQRAPISYLPVLPLVALVLLTSLVLVVPYPFHHSFRTFLLPYTLLVSPVLIGRRFHTPQVERGHGRGILGIFQ